MQVGVLLRRTQKLAMDNSPVILSGVSISGVITTAYLASRASFSAARVINRVEHETGTADTVKQRLKERIPLVWKFYIPATISGAATIACIVGGTKASMTKTAVAYSLLGASEKTFSEYKEKVVEQLGAKKEETIREEIARDKVRNGPEGIIVTGNGKVLCYESHSGRYFMSDMETLKRAVNEVNAKMLREMDARLSDFYYLVGLPTTQFCERSGWQNSKLLELSFYPVMTEDNQPCIAFDYNYIEPF